ncbi:protein hobbit-like [Bacillus rossius redtenbacheri]|uniref:protein hobbit-like n=1 Tax=Bacillus rossius redtenbacheri TaxID=93214 RepID=UPI002FDECE91
MFIKSLNVCKVPQFALLTALAVVGLFARLARPLSLNSVAKLCPRTPSPSQTPRHATLRGSLTLFVAVTLPFAAAAPEALSPLSGYPRRPKNSYAQKPLRRPASQLKYPGASFSKGREGLLTSRIIPGRPDARTVDKGVVSSRDGPWNLQGRSAIATVPRQRTMRGERRIRLVESVHLGHEVKPVVQITLSGRVRQGLAMADTDGFLPRLVRRLARSLLQVELTVGRVALASLSVHHVRVSKPGLFSLVECSLGVTGATDPCVIRSTSRVHRRLPRIAFSPGRMIHVEEARLRGWLLGGQAPGWLGLDVHGARATLAVPRSTRDHVTGAACPLRHLLQLAQLAGLRLHGVVATLAWRGATLQLGAAEVRASGSTAPRAAGLRVRGGLAALRRRDKCEPALSAWTSQLAVDAIFGDANSVELTSVAADNCTTVVAAEELSLLSAGSLLETETGGMSLVPPRDVTLDIEMITFGPTSPKKCFLNCKMLKPSDILKKDDGNLCISVQNFGLIAISVPLPRIKQTNIRTVGVVSSEVNVGRLSVAYKQKCILWLKNFSSKTKLYTDTIMTTSAAEKLHAMYDHIAVYQLMSSILVNYHDSDCASDSHSGSNKLFVTCASWMRRKYEDHTAKVKDLCVVFRPSEDDASFTCRFDDANIQFVAKPRLSSQDCSRCTRWEVALGYLRLYSSDDVRAACGRRSTASSEARHQLEQARGEEQLSVVVGSLCAEWSPRVARCLAQCVRCMVDYRSLCSTELDSSSSDKPDTNFNYSTCTARKMEGINVCFLLRMDSMIVSASSVQLVVVSKETVLSYLSQRICSSSPSTDSEEQQMVLAKYGRVVHERTSGITALHLLGNNSCSWSTGVHRSFMAVSNTFAVDGDLLKESSMAWLSKFQVQATGIVHFTIGVSPSHTIKLSSDELSISGSQLLCRMRSKRVSVAVDDVELANVDKLMVYKSSSDEEMVAERLSCENFLLPRNSAWCVTAESIKVCFPHEQSFAEVVHEDLRNVILWLKQLHMKEKPVGCQDSALALDVNFKVKRFVWEMAEEPFEARLLDNYMLLKDEQEECSQRFGLLEARIKEVRAAGTALSAGQVEELFRKLSQKNAEIYIKRSRLMKDNPAVKRSIVVCFIRDLSLMLLADPSQHGASNITRIMKDMDPKSPWPTEEPLFSVLWCRSVSAGCADLQLRLRDFPSPLCHAVGWSMWGRLVGAQRAATRTAERCVVVSLAPPWPDEHLFRNMHPVKLYHDLCCEVQFAEVCWGPSLAPVVSQCILDLEKLLPHSRDPSRLLRCWDKLRLLAHGQLTVVCNDLTVMLPSSPVPRDVVDGLQIHVTTFAIDLSDGRAVCEGAVVADVCTLTGHDSHTLLQLGSARASIGLLWGCSGDARDHHAVLPCAPDKLPGRPHALVSQPAIFHTRYKEHDSFREFRSQHLDLRVMVRLKPAGCHACATVLVYSQTLGWLKKWSEAFTAVIRPVRRGAVFHNPGACKTSLFRHLHNVKLVFETPVFELQYWTSFAKQDGFTVIGGPVLLRCEYSVALRLPQDGLRRRPSQVWNPRHATCDLSQVSFTLGGADRNPRGACSGRATPRDSLVRVSAVRYALASTLSWRSGGVQEDSRRPRHRLALLGLRAAWNRSNRDGVFAVIAAYTDAQILQRNLSSNLVHISTPSQNAGRVTKSPSTSPHNDSWGVQMPAMLRQLLRELHSKPMAHCEAACETEPVVGPGPRGPNAGRRDDVISINFLLTFADSQVLLKGCEAPGFVVVSATTAELSQRAHTPVRRHAGLVSKTMWVARVDDMRCHATTAEDGRFLPDEVVWLDTGISEELYDSGMGRPEDTPAGAAFTIGVCCGGSPHYSSVQLQCVVSRCSCELAYMQYSQEVIDPSTLSDVPLALSDDEVGLAEDCEDVANVLTFTHEDLDICTNAHQCAAVLDVVRTLLLHVDPGRRRTCDLLQRMRFRWQLLSGEDPRRPLLELQLHLRSLYSNLQRLKKVYYDVQKSLTYDPDNEDFMQELEDLELRVAEYEKLVRMQSEELHAMLVCCNEAQASVQRRLAHMPFSVVRRNEVSLKHVRWQLTDAAGQHGIANCILWNTLYANTVCSDGSGEHALEVEYLSVENLLPGEPYQKVLCPTQIDASMPVDRKLSLRVICREKCPVGGISIIEHFEINVAPLTIGLTKKFFYTILRFFFPEGQLHARRNEAVSRNKKDVRSRGKFYIDIDSNVEKMKTRALRNKLFVYTKLTAVPVRLSYRGRTKVEEVRDLRLAVPTLQYHSMTWTWLDLLLAVRSDCQRLVFSQTIKQKLKIRRHRNSPDVSDAEREETEAMELLHGHRPDTL